MFKHIIMSTNHHGQTYSGFRKTMKFCEKMISQKYDIHHVPSNYDLKTNLNLLYEKNVELKGPRLNIGGDHSMSIATGACSLNVFPHVKFIWIDAHPDINTYESSSTKNVHGMPLAYLTGITDSNNYPFLHKILKYENLLYIGIRSVDPHEEHIIKNNNIGVIKSRLCNNDIYEVLNQIDDFVGKNYPLHVSFDVDSLDPAIIPSTGTPVKGGLRKSSAKKILSHLLENHNVFNMDFTELNLTLGTKAQQEISQKNTVEIMKSLKIV